MALRDGNRDGWIEERPITVSSMLTDYSDWPYLAQCFRLEYRATDLATGKMCIAVRYGITSQPPEVANPHTLLRQVRTEWVIETGNHGRRDVTLHEDDTMISQNTAAHVMATINNTVVGLVLKHGYTNLAHARRVWDYTIGALIHNVRTRE